MGIPFRDSIKAGNALAELQRAAASDATHPGILATVTDTGCGMSAEIAEQAFDPFYSTRPPGEGTGLGLSVVQGIVQDWGGSVRLDTAPGKGACIHIRLPLFPA
jgi:signal transduction histidine kinase